MIEPTQLKCPAHPAGGTHHLVPKANALTCRYCGKTEKQLREEQAK